MSADPSVLALGRLFELCKRHADVLQLLVSNPTVLDSLSKYPEQAVAALNGLSDAQDLDEPDLPYGLSSLGTADMLARVRDLNALDISYLSLETTYAHNVVHRTLSGNMVRSRVVCSSEQAQRTGCATLLLMRGPHQPYMPNKAGSLGVLLSATPRLEDWPAFENVFVSQTKDYGAQRFHADDWVYAGRYELTDSRPLDVDEIASLPEEEIHINRRNGEHLARMHARVYLSVVDQLDEITEADISRCVAAHKAGVIIAAIRCSDIKDALLDGTVVLRAFAMRLVGYDVGMPMLLEQTRKRLEVEQEAEDAGIEGISGPPRGTKRKTPPAGINPPRPGPGPSTLSSWQRDKGPHTPRMTRPKRSTINASINYRESDSEGDFEPVRTAGPSSSASQLRRVVQ